MPNLLPAITNKINPWYLTGFADGEGSFSFGIIKKEPRLDGTIRYHAQVEFNLPASNNPLNKTQLEAIQKYLDVGKIYTSEANNNNQSLLKLRVTSIEDCFRVRKHFEEFPLLTDKAKYFKLWCKVLDFIINKEHLNQEGLNKIVALKALSPKGLSLKLQETFPNYKNYLAQKEEYAPNWNNINIHWLAGFINADGHFKAQVRKSNNAKLGKQVQPLIAITQHTNNLTVLYKIQEFLNLGHVSIRTSQPGADYKITNLNESNLFIEKFKEAQLLGAKSLDYNDFCTIITLLNENKPLTKEVLSKIELINSNVNNKRLF